MESSILFYLNETFKEKYYLFNLVKHLFNYEKLILHIF